MGHGVKQWAIVCSAIGALLLFFSAQTPEQAAPGPAEVSAPAGTWSPASAQSVAQKVREAAVLVVQNGGIGSGLYVTWKGHHLVITASHVAESQAALVLERDEEVAYGEIVYEDGARDIAILRLQDPLTTRTPMPLRIGSFQVGDSVTYTGFPNRSDLVTVRGYVAGLSEEYGFLMQGYAWYGASGSGVVDMRTGHLLGILTGIELGLPTGQPLESMVLVSSATHIDLAVLEAQLQDDSTSEP